MDYLAVAIAGVGCMGLGIAIGMIIRLLIELKLREW